MIIITERGIKGLAFQTIAELRAEWIARLCARFPSDSASEKYGGLGTPPGMVKTKGQRRTEELPEYELSIENDEYESGIEFKRKDIERDKTGLISDMQTVQWVRRCNDHEVELANGLIVAGTGATLGKAYDGKNFFASNHVAGKSGTWKNLLTKTEVTALQVTAPTKPTAAESIDALLGVIAYMLNVPDDQGKKANPNSRQFLCMTGVTLWARMVKAIVNPTIDAGETNTIVSLRAAQNGTSFDISILPNPGLDYTYEFDVYSTDGPGKPFIIQEEVPIEFTALDQNSEFYKQNHKVTAKAYTRKGLGFWRPELAAHATFST